MNHNVNFNNYKDKLNLGEFKSKLKSNYEKIEVNIKNSTELISEKIEEKHVGLEKPLENITADLSKNLTNIVTDYQNTEAKITKYFESYFDTNKEQSKKTNNNQTYDLTKEELEAIAYVCYKEQEIAGAKGAADEASLMANRYELYADKEKFPTLYDYARNSKWWAKSKTRMDNPGDVPPEVEAAIYDVLVKGERTLPPQIDEHDCTKDIVKASNNGVRISVNNRDAYISGVTLLENKYGAKYTFYTFAGDSGDPMGYTKTAMKIIE